MDNFLFLISSLRWQDIVDISLVSYILLRFYVLFRGTNAFRVKKRGYGRKMILVITCN